MAAISEFPIQNTEWRPNRAVYGLRTAPGEWHESFADELQKQGLPTYLNRMAVSTLTTTQ